MLEKITIKDIPQNNQYLAQLIGIENLNGDIETLVRKHKIIKRQIRNILNKINRGYRKTRAPLNQYIYFIKNLSKYEKRELKLEKVNL